MSAGDSKHVNNELEREEREHASNIGLVALALAGHEVGDFGDCSVNDAVTTIVDFERPAHEVLQARRAAAKRVAEQAIAEGRLVRLPSSHSVERERLPSANPAPPLHDGEF
jgi:hypothetical protein